MCWKGSFAEEEDHEAEEQAVRQDRSEALRLAECDRCVALLEDIEVDELQRTVIKIRKCV